MSLEIPFEVMISEKLEAILNKTCDQHKFVQLWIVLL